MPYSKNIFKNRSKGLYGHIRNQSSERIQAKISILTIFQSSDQLAVYLLFFRRNITNIFVYFFAFRKNN